MKIILLFLTSITFLTSPVAMANDKIAITKLWYKIDYFNIKDLKGRKHAKVSFEGFHYKRSGKPDVFGNFAKASIALDNLKKDCRRKGFSSFRCARARTAAKYNLAHVTIWRCNRFNRIVSSISALDGAPCPF